MSKPHSKSTFQESWFGNPKYSLWVSKDGSNPSKALCKLCHKAIDLKSGGSFALDSHKKGQKHQELEKARKTNAMGLFVSSQSSTSAKEGPLSPQSTSNSSEVRSTEQKQLSSFIIDENTLNAEILWCLNVVKSHHTFRSCDPLKNLFKVMFPDSAVPEKFSLGKDKARYMIIYGIAPAFKQKLRSMINTSPWYSVSFDESLNKEQQKCQMDVNIRYWNDKRNIAETAYLDSQFLLRPNAENLKSELIESMSNLDMAKFLQLSMDGPNTNWNVLDLVNGHLVENGHKNLVEIGSCSLHVVHGAFQTGALKTGWELNKVLKAMYNIFKESPAQRDIYLKEGSLSEFPLKFWEPRWIEDKEVAERALEVWKSVVATIRYWEGLSKSKKPKNNKSFDCLVNHYQDLLMTAKLNFFAFIAGILKPFLVLFQTDNPMLPFMYDELSEISKRLIVLIYKKEKIDEAKTVAKTMKEDWLNNKNNQKEEFLIDVGAATKDILSNAKVATEKIRKFRGECKLFVVHLLLKLHERVPIQYALVRNSSSLNPNKMALQGALMSKRFVRLADQLYSLKFISSSVADNAKFQYDQFMKKEVVNNKEEFLSFDMRKQRVDVFLHGYIGINPQYKDLWSICKLIFILQHGQSYTERGFSINKKISDVNMQEDALISQRLVYDYLMKNEKEIWDFPITPDLRKSCKLAYQKKRLHDQQTKEARVENEKSLKRKHMKDEIETVKRQKVALEQSVKTLRENLICEAIAGDGSQTHAVKAASFAKTLVEKESTLKDLNIALEKLEDKFKVLK